jgi:hypothetical protein
MEALLLFVAVLLLVVDFDEDALPIVVSTPAPRSVPLDRRFGAAQRLRHADNRITQLTDQAVLAMMAEVRRQPDAPAEP